MSLDAIKASLDRRDTKLEQLDQQTGLIKEGNLAKFEKGLAEFRNSNPTDESWRDWIVLAAELNQPQIVQCLLDHGVSVSYANEFGDTALHAAAIAGNVETVQILLSATTDVDVRSAHGDTPLHSAIGTLDKVTSGHHAEVMTLLCEAGADLNAQNNSAETPLHRVVNHMSSEMLRWYVFQFQSDTPPESQFDEPQPYHQAMLDMARVLLERGANPEIRGGNAGFRETPLGAAARIAPYPLVELLVQYGASPTAKDNEGDTPIGSARQLGRTRVLRLLEQATQKTKGTLKTTSDNLKAIQKLSDDWWNQAENAPMLPTPFGEEVRMIVPFRDSLAEQGEKVLSLLENEHAAFPNDEKVTSELCAHLAKLCSFYMGAVNHGMLVSSQDDFTDILVERDVPDDLIRLLIRVRINMAQNAEKVCEYGFRAFNVDSYIPAVYMLAVAFAMGECFGTALYWLNIVLKLASEQGLASSKLATAAQAMQLEMKSDGKTSDPLLSQLEAQGFPNRNTPGLRLELQAQMEAEARQRKVERKRQEEAARQEREKQEEAVRVTKADNLIQNVLSRKSNGWCLICGRKLEEGFLNRLFDRIEYCDSIQIRHQDTVVSGSGKVHARCKGQQYDHSGGTTPPIGSH